MRRGGRWRWRTSEGPERKPANANAAESTGRNPGLQQLQAAALVYRDPDQVLAR